MKSACNSLHAKIQVHGCSRFEKEKSGRRFTLNIGLEIRATCYRMNIIESRDKSHLSDTTMFWSHILADPDRESRISAFTQTRGMGNKLISVGWK